MYKIAICGKANTGKNTLATHLQDEIRKRDDAAHIVQYGRSSLIDFEAKTMAFADPIKEIVMVMFPNANKNCLYGPSQLRAEAIPGAFKDGKPLTYRQALIDIGTEVGRAYNDKLWLENFDCRYEELLIKDKYSLVIVTDVRFRNEFDHLKKKGFFQIRLYRDTGKASEINHVSETNQNSILDEEFDYVLFNNKSLEDLCGEVRCQILPRLRS
jgi:hypothetical protein